MTQSSRSIDEAAAGPDKQTCAEASRVCACFNFRKASRIVTQFFDDVLQPSGLRSTQFVILVAVYLEQPASPTKLAETLVMDRSTLARNLTPLQRQGLLNVERGQDRRTRVLSLTKAGVAALEGAIPLWKQAQMRFVEQLGADLWPSLLGGLNAAVEAGLAVQRPSA